MNKIFTPIYILLFISLGAKAQSLQEMFCNIPHEQSPYLDKAMREELLKFCDNGKDTCSQITSALNTTAWISCCCTNLIVLHPNEVYTEEYRLLPNEDSSDSLLCLIRTYNAPEQESLITLYDRKWNEQRKINTKRIQSKTILAQPDTMSEDEFKELNHTINFTMTKASFVKEDDKEIKLHPTTPLITNEEKNKLKSLLVQTIIKWNGEIFN